MKCPATGKVVHASRDDADRHAAALRAHRGKRDTESYPCRAGCGGWHVTTRSHKKLAARVRRALRHDRPRRRAKGRR